jgi:hypothetical protein
MRFAKGASVIRMLQAALCTSLQGHVVAEQQLTVPSSWIEWDGDAIPAPVSKPAGRPLQFGEEQRSSGRVIVVRGANDLCVEVSLPLLPFCMGGLTCCLFSSVIRYFLKHWFPSAAMCSGEPRDRCPGPMGGRRAFPAGRGSDALPVQGTPGQ